MNKKKLNEMKDGEIAVVLRWSAGSKINVGKVVQRYNDKVVLLGEGYGKSYTTILQSHTSSEIEVEILAPGTLLGVTSAGLTTVDENGKPLGITPKNKEPETKGDLLRKTAELVDALMNHGNGYVFDKEGTGKPRKLTKQIHKNTKRLIKKYGFKDVESVHEELQKFIQGEDPMKHIMEGLDRMFNSKNPNVN